MRLTWRDLGATIVMVPIIVVYSLYLDGSSGWLVSSTRGTTAAVLVLGMVGCSFGRPEDLYRKGRSLSTKALGTWTSALGGLALLAAVIGIATGEGFALGVLVACVTALWITATLRHAFIAPADAQQPERIERGPDNHEVIEQPPVHHDVTR